MDSDRFTNQSAIATAATTTRNGKLLKRSEAARLLGMSVTTLRRREGDVLKPIVGEDGVHLFDETEVRAVMVTRRGRAALAAMGPSSGDTAAEVFTLLDEGVHPVEIVKRLRLTPDVVVSLNEQWSAMRGGFTVSREQVGELALIARTASPSTAADAIACVRRRVEALTRMRQGSARCHACYDSTASICEACMVVTRGPLGSLDVRVERRTNDECVEELRVVADVYWDDVGDSGGNVSCLRSDWHSATELASSPIADLVEGIQRRSAPA